jgi:pyruvate dehydrogenase E1 component
VWAFADARGRGFLLGATAGRTTLVGEGLQHADGHSHVLFSVVPNCRAYDPAFAYELAAIVKHGIHEMYDDEQDVFYYLTLYNETYSMPALPDGVDEHDIVRGLYRFAAAPEGPSRRATILFSGSAQGAAREAQRVLAEDHDVGAELWSVPGWKQLREEALSVERWNRLHPTDEWRTPFVTEALSQAEGPVLAVTDHMKTVADQIARWAPQPFVPLGTDGFGRSDTREQLRRHFEVDAPSIVVGVLDGLNRAGAGSADEVAEAIRRYGIDPDRPDPRVVDQ